MRGPLAAVVALILAGCGGTAPTSVTPTSAPRPTTPMVVTASPEHRAQCIVVATRAGALPDPRCTPGQAMVGVTAAQVCTPGWAKAHRKVTVKIRRQVLAEYGYDPAEPFPGEVDHLISLELGGTNAEDNLWPEPGRVPNDKDVVEGRLKRAVCAGKITLAQAQREIAKDWTVAG